MGKIKILLFERYLDAAGIFKGFLETEGYHVVSVSREKELFDLLKKGDIDILIINLAGQEGQIFYIIECLKGIVHKEDIIIIVDFSNKNLMRTVGELIRKGIRNLIPSNLSTSELKTFIEKVYQQKNLRGEFQKLFEETMEFWELASLYQKGVGLLSLDNPELIPRMIIKLLSEQTDAFGGVLFLKSDLDDGRYDEHTSYFINDFTGSRESCLIMNEKEGIFDEGKRMTLFLKIMGEIAGIIDLYKDPETGCFNMDDFRRANLMGKFASIAMQIFLRLRNAAKAYIKDERGICYSYPFFREFVIKEIQKSRRHKRPMALAVIKILTSNEKTRGISFEGFIHEILSIMVKTFRDSDIFCRVDRDEYLLILPETDYMGSLIAIRRFEKNVEDYISRYRGDLLSSIRIVGRSVSCPKDGEEISILERELDRKFQAAKQSLYWKSDLSEKNLWDVFHNIFSIPEIDPVISKSAKLMLTDDELERIHRFIIEDMIGINYKALLYILSYNFPENINISMLPLKSDSSVKIYFLGHGGGERFDHGAFFPIKVEDEKLLINRACIYLTEDSAYALLGKKMENGWNVFHTSDEYLVERLIYKVQEEYKLQLQL